MAARVTSSSLTSHPRPLGEKSPAQLRRRPSSEASRGERFASDPAHLAPSFITLARLTNKRRPRKVSPLSAAAGTQLIGAPSNGRRLSLKEGVRRRTDGAAPRGRGGRFRFNIRPVAECSARAGFQDGPAMWRDVLETSRFGLVEFDLLHTY